MIITKVNCPADKIAIKCPYSMVPEGVTVHNTANDASAMSEISYMLGNNYYTSFHYATDDYRTVQGIEENRNGFHASDGATGFGNRKTIAIEICYSKSGGERFLKAEQNAAELIAWILKRYGWGIDKVKRHYDYAPNKKYCPHRTMDLGWERFLKMIEEKLNPPKKELTIKNITNKKVRLKIDAHLWNLDFNTYAEAKSVKQFKKGDIIEVSALADHPIGAQYYLTEYSYSNKINNGFNVVDCEDYDDKEIKVGSKVKITTRPGNTCWVADDVQKVYGIYQVREDVNAGGNFDWADNGIPEECIDLVDAKGKKRADSDKVHAKKGDMFVFAKTFTVRKIVTEKNKKYYFLDYKNNEAYAFWVIGDFLKKV